MSDEQVIQKIADGIRHRYDLFADAPGQKLSDAADIMAALRDAGWELYRPDECERLEIKGPARIPVLSPWQMFDPAGRRHSIVGDSRVGTYRLVPVGESNE